MQDKTSKLDAVHNVIDSTLNSIYDNDVDIVTLKQRCTAVRRRTSRREND